MQKIGEYFLNQKFEEIENEVTEVKDAFSYLPKTFKDEKLYLGEIVNFHNHDWITYLVVEKQRIYKILLLSDETSNSSNAINNKQLIFDLKQSFSESYKFERTRNEMHTFTTDWGNIILSMTNDGLIKISFTLGESFDNISFFRKIGFLFIGIFNSIFGFTIKFNLIFRLSDHPDDVIDKWIWLRTLEWAAFPLYLSQILVPFLLLFINPILLILSFVVLTWLWALIRYKFVSLFLANIAQHISILSWVCSIIMFIYFILNKEIFISLISLFYPFISSILLRFVPRANLYFIQTMFMNKLGYFKNIVNE